MEYLHKLSTVSGSSPDNIVSDIRLHIHRYAKYRSHFVHYMWSGPHMLITGRHTSGQGLLLHTAIYLHTCTYTHTHRLTFSIMIKASRYYIVI